MAETHPRDHRPICAPEPQSGMTELVHLLCGRRVVALTGAGCSTESGIPDYRGAGARQRKRPPIQHLEFLRRAEVRRRYWARSVIGWPRFHSAQPNPAHRALAELERAGALAGIITQNVDRLHTRAGSRHVVELHGALAEVECLDCGDIVPRDDLQQRLLALNPGWQQQGAVLAPDGDAELPDALVRRFRPMDCTGCGGVLKPHVVFFGGNVPRARVDRAWSLLQEADALLVVGSSLAVFSGYRFVRKAAALGIPIGIVNLGPTRGDELADVRVSGAASRVLSQLRQQLT